MSESQGNNTFNRATSNMPVMSAAPNSNAAPTPPPSNNMPFTASPAKPQPAPQVVQAMPQVGPNSAPSTPPVTVANPVPAVQPSATPSAPIQPVTSTTAPVQTVQPNVPTAQAAQPTAPDAPDKKAAKKAKKSHAKVSKKTAPAAVTTASTTQPNTPGRQIDFFAEQNARTAEKKAKNSKIIKLASIIGGIVAIIIIAGIVGWLVFFGNKDEKLTVEEINNLRFTFGEIYDADNSLEDVRQRYDEIMKSDIGRENADAVKLQLLFFYVSNGFMARGVEIGETIDVEKLNQEAKSAYYNQMYNAYATTGQLDKATAAQYESAMLRGDTIDEEDDNNQDGGQDNNDPSGDDTTGDDDQNNGSGEEKPDNPSGGDSTNTPQVYTCNGVEYSFPVECAVNGVEPNEF